MKKNIIKFISFIIFISLLLIPSKSVFAASQTMYTEDMTNVSSTLNRTTSYNFGSWQYKFNKMYYHSITTDDGNEYLGYCLDIKLKAPNAGGVLNSTESQLYDRSSNVMSAERIELLKNILAGGYQFNGSVSDFKTSADSDAKYNYLATQILVWEVMTGVRNNYDPTTVSAASPNTLDFIATDSKLKTAYEVRLSNASLLAGNGKPDSFGKTYTLHWNDGNDRYESNAINIGFYNKSGSIPEGIAVSDKNSENYVYIYSANEITTAQKVNFNFTAGNTLDDSGVFKWFSFSTGPQSNQRVLLSYFRKTATADLNVKTEEGKFTILKQDSTTKKSIKGAVFELYKCKNRYTACTEKVATIDMKKKTVSSDITIKKSGLYMLKETIIPFGFEKISDTYLTLNIDDNGKVTATSDDPTHIKKNPNKPDQLQIVISNDEKYFNIKKVDGRTGTNINGATFKIKKSDGTVMKFEKNADGQYRYDEDGTIEELVASNLSTYSISLLPEGEYILEEVAVPYPYVLSSNQAERETKFKITNSDNSYLQVYNYSTKKYNIDTDVTITVKNFETKVTIIKHGKSNKKVPGVIFELYDSKKQSQIPLKIDNGQYVYDKNVSPIQLTTDSAGQIVIRYLPEGTYYLKEVQTPDDSGLVIDPSNEWTELKIYVKRDSATPYNYSKEIRNAKGEFCFYKIDEDGNYLDTGTFKLQMYNESTSRFEDQALIFNNSTNKFTIDSKKESNVYTFSPVSNGETCFVDINAKGKYKIVEIEAPDGFVLPSASEAQVEIEINENGYAIGDAVIINRKQVVNTGAEAQAELIINIQTGQTRIRYTIVICSILAIIIGLLVFKKKIDKK